MAPRNKAPRSGGANKRKEPTRVYRMSTKALAKIVQRALDPELRATLNAWDETIETIENNMRQQSPLNGNMIVALMTHAHRMDTKLLHLRMPELHPRTDVPLGQVATWLGWLQGAACALGYLTIDAGAIINRRIGRPTVGG